jgi:hypothetical protein
MSWLKPALGMALSTTQPAGHAQPLVGFQIGGELLIAEQSLSKLAHQLLRLAKKLACQTKAVAKHTLVKILAQQQISKFLVTGN